ncbi:MAG: hypothetical protein HXY23_04945 [Parvularculaceae bacterium]|nr:hypothetical protein [Parvularculaceae bacterium]
MAAGLCLAACATSGVSIQDELRAAASDIGGSFVLFRRDGDDILIRSGTVRGGAEPPPTLDAECARGSAHKIQVVVARSARFPCNELDAAWTTGFAKSLSLALAGVFADAAPSLAVSLSIFPDRTRIDVEADDDVGADPVNLSFASTELEFAPMARRLISHAVAHEVFHAGLHLGRARAAPESFERFADFERILEEAAAELFGICVSLATDNVASRAESNVTVNGRPGGVLTDSELRQLVRERGPMDGSGLDLSNMGQAAANSIWTSVIGPTYLASGDSDDGRTLSSLCSAENLASIDGIRRLVGTFAEDGSDAPPFPDWNAKIGVEYDGVYRSAHARWLSMQNLAPE